MNNNSFSFKEFFKFWLKKWPITLICFGALLAFGVISTTQTKIRYESKIDVLIIQENFRSNSGDFVDLIPSSLIAGEVEKDEKFKEDGCSVKVEVSGNVATLITKCDTKEISSEYISQLVEKTQKVSDDLYSGNIALHSLNPAETTATSNRNSNLKTIAVMAACGIFIALVIIFIMFDQKLSKGTKKK